MLIVETADMLQAPLFTAEALLRAHGTDLLLLLQPMRTLRFYALYFTFALQVQESKTYEYTQ